MTFHFDTGNIDHYTFPVDRSISFVDPMNVMDETNRFLFITNWRRILRYFEYYTNEMITDMYGFYATTRRFDTWMDYVQLKIPKSGACRALIDGNDTNGRTHGIRNGAWLIVNE